MADNLNDVRSKVPDRDHRVLAAVSQATGRDISEIVREIIGHWVDSEVKRATSVTSILRDCEGFVGSRGE